MEQLLLNIARGLVENKEAVSVTGGDKNEDGAIVFHLSVASEDMGRVIGKSGNVASSIRTIIKSISSREGKKVFVKFGE